MRKKIFETIEPSQNNNCLNSIYDVTMIVVIVLSILPLGFKHPPFILRYTDAVCFVVFVIDYLLRWLTADYKYGKKSFLSFVRYPFSFGAIIDLLSIFASVSILNVCFRLLRIVRLVKAFRVFRAFRMFSYSKSVRIVIKVFENSKETLIAVFALAVGYIIISALVVFSVEPETFESFFEAIYWSTVSLTTVGYGDVYPVTVIGRAATIVSSIVGVAIVALPSGIITAAYIDEVNKEKEKQEDK